MRISSWTELAGGLLMAAIGIFFFVGSLGMRMGTAQKMGPAYFPMVLSVLLLAVAAAILLRCVRIEGGTFDMAWRPFAFVSAGLLVFGLTLGTLGLIPAIVLTVVVSGFADPDNRIAGTLALGVSCAVAAWLIFRVGLHLPMPAFRGIPWIL